MNRLSKTLLTATAAAALALPAGAQAKHGADDPAGHVRHAAHQTASTGTAAAHQTRHRHRGRHHHGRHHTRRADDGSVRGRGRGTDDGPNHT
jgi:hypothetical protein